MKQFKGPKKQGGWVGLAIAGVGLASSLFGGGGGTSGAPTNASYYDPYAPYRGAAATQLNNLMANPSSITNSPTYQAYLQAAQRQSAAQGYTGSGNALAAAASAGGQAYQQQFNNLAMLSGATTSPSSGASMAGNAAYANQQNNQNMWGNLGSLFANSGAGASLGNYLDNSNAIGNLFNIFPSF